MDNQESIKKISETRDSFNRALSSYRQKEEKSPNLDKQSIELKVSLALNEEESKIKGDYQHSKEALADILKPYQNLGQAPVSE